MFVRAGLFIDAAVTAIPSPHLLGSCPRVPATSCVAQTLPRAGQGLCSAAPSVSPPLLCLPRVGRGWVCFPRPAPLLKGCPLGPQPHHHSLGQGGGGRRKHCRYLRRTRFRSPSARAGRHQLRRLPRELSGVSVLGMALRVSGPTGSAQITHLN